MFYIFGRICKKKKKSFKPNDQRAQSKNKFTFIVTLPWEFKGIIQ